MNFIHLYHKSTMKKQLLLLFLLGMIAIAHCQDLNKYDDKGKKDGRWKIYYDKNWTVVKDSSKATNYWYTHYDHGKRIYTEASWGCKSCKFQDSLFSTDNSKIKLLDGKYTWYDKKGNISSEHYFVKGDPVWWKQYHPNGKLYLLFDYTKKCEGEPLSWYMYQYDKTGTLKNTMPISKGCGGTWTNIW